AAAQANDWAQALPPEPLTTQHRTAIRAGLAASGLDFVQIYRHGEKGWTLVEEVLPEGTLAPEALDLSSELDAALASGQAIHSPPGALAAVARQGPVHAIPAGMRVQPDFFAQVDRVREGIGFYRRFGIVRDVSRTYLWLLVAAIVVVLTGF